MNNEISLLDNLVQIFPRLINSPKERTIGVEETLEKYQDILYISSKIRIGEVSARGLDLNSLAGLGLSEYWIYLIAPNTRKQFKYIHSLDKFTRQLFRGFLNYVTSPKQNDNNTFKVGNVKTFLASPAGLTNLYAFMLPTGELVPEGEKNISDAKDLSYEMFYRPKLYFVDMSDEEKREIFNDLYRKFLAAQEKVNSMLLQARFT